MHPLLVFGDNELLHLLLKQRVILTVIFHPLRLNGGVKCKLHEVFNSFLFLRCLIRFHLHFLLYQAGSVKVLGVIFLPVDHKPIVVLVGELFGGELDLGLLAGQVGGHFEVKLLG